MNRDDLSQFLLKKKGIREDVVKKLLDENVDGDSLVDLNEEDLKSLDIKLGDRKKIMRIVKEMKLSNGCAAVALGSDTVQGVEGTDITINTVYSPLGNTYTLVATSSHNEGNTKNMTSSSTMLPNLSEESRGTNTSHHILPFSSPEAINIKDILNKSARGKILLQRFQRPDSSSISRKYVSQLVRICVHSMVTDLETLYPTSLQKENLAKAIVSAFPILKSSLDNVEGYEYLFDSLSRTGIIEWRLKTLRVKASPSQKKYRRRIPATSAVEFEENDSSIASKITWLQNQVPSSIHKAEIMEAMKATFHYRRNYILNHNPSMSEVLKAYPKFKDFGGLLIDAEFKEIYPNVGDFLAIFPTQYAPRILKYVRENRLDIYERLSFEKDENFSALLMLADLLPVAGFRKKDSGSQSLVPFRDVSK
ncbi:hypothetical protein JTE90_021264 [Oedothorax gibbosus]|uniref:SAM domain-containing protein n=1 Tax=Oedothorax gibbosus TaxID=931172 RepID=A0AAV6TYV6_9ARAC|nr:hypothetical protein JTE90_021264 [Oedothorax gibbosus]KAG8177263.1 hypothetical protein JTE90_021264 [Oedothorax gibbosus]